MGHYIGKTNRGKGSKVMAITDAADLPLAIWTTSAQHHEVKLVGRTLEIWMLKMLPKRLIADRAYHSVKLRRELAVLGIELIAPHRKNHKKLKTQDGRKLRRYKRRWNVERYFALLHNYKRYVTRYDLQPKF